MTKALDAISERTFERLGIGFGAIACATIGHQVLHEWQTPGPSSVSLWFVAGFFLIYFFWFLYGVRFRRLGIWLPNALASAMYLVFAAAILAKG
jgi:uncharacterized protein with PQ loop repeat